MRSIITIVVIVVLAAGFAACSKETTGTSSGGSTASVDDQCGGVKDPDLCAKVKRMTRDIRSSAASASNKHGVVETAKRTAGKVAKVGGGLGWWLLVIPLVALAVVGVIWGVKRGWRLGGTGGAVLLVLGTLGILWLLNATVGFPKSLVPSAIAVVVFAAWLFAELLPGRLDNGLLILVTAGVALVMTTPLHYVADAVEWALEFFGADVTLLGDAWWWWVVTASFIAMLYYPRFFHRASLRWGAYASTWLLLGTLSTSA